MPEAVSLTSVIGEMEMLSDGVRAFLNRNTGEIYGASDELISRVESGDEEVEYLEWEVEVVDRLQEILGSDDWLELPQRNSYDDYGIMQRFCLESCEGKVQEELLSAIRGSGAFGRFKDQIHLHGIHEAWHEFRRDWFAEEAKHWLEANNIKFDP